MRVLVTGSQGYLGSVLSKLLLEEGFEIVGLDTGWFDDCLFQKPCRSYRQLKQDFRDIKVADLAGFDAVMHLAALSNDPLGNLNPALTMQINHLGTVRLARLAREAGVGRFIVSSSCSIYGKSGDALIDETSELNPVTPYGRAKALVDRDVAMLADESFSPVFLRNATAYGASPRLRLDLVLNDLVSSAFLTGKILMMSDGTPWRPLVHAEDIARAFIAAARAPREAVHNEAFNIGATSENYQISQLAEIVCRTVPDSEIEYAAGAGPDLRCYRVDFNKAAQQLPGFQAQWDVARGARQLLEAYRERPLTADEAAGASYFRLAKLQQLERAGKLDDQLRWRDISSEVSCAKTTLSNAS